MIDVIIKEAEINDKDYVIDDISNRLLNKELRLLLLTEYKGKELKIKNSIKIKADTKLNIKDEVRLKVSSRIIIGIGIVKGIEDGYYVINNLKIHNMNTIDDLFTNIDNKDLNKYKEGLFYYYYKFLIRFIEDNNLKHSFKKLSAVSSYIVSKQLFKDKGYKVSPNNVFIRSCGIEFDLLLLKDKVNNNNNKYVYEIDEVDTIVELKASGYINNTNSFKDYITYNDRNEIEDKKILKEVQSKPFIYLSYFEHKNNYDKMIDVLKKNNKKEMILSIKEDNEHFYVPNNYDIDKII